MCGIFGYIGTKNAPNTLLRGLQKLEYRGYDSAGIAIGGKESFSLIKSVGKVSDLGRKASDFAAKWEQYSYGIAHTRWATHGGVTEENCHPHHSSDEKIYLVHNGIVENYAELKAELEAKGYKFYGQTDSEVVAKLAEENWQWSLLKTVEYILPMLEGAYALLFISKENPDEIVAIKYGSPMIFGYSDDRKEFFFSSDAGALAWVAENAIFLDDGDMVHVKNGEFIIKSEGKLTSKPAEKIDTENLKAEKGDFKHFMLKEIYEQPKVLQDGFRGRIDFAECRLNAAAFEEVDKYDFEKVVFVACGTSYHAGWLGAYWFEDLAGMNARVEVASEFEYKNIRVEDDTLYVFISQSWETADAIEPLKYLKSKGAKTFGIVNVVGSTISRLTDFGLFTRAGTEVGVASTKAFTAQISAVLMLALKFGEKHGLSRPQYRKIIEELQRIPAKIEEIVARSGEIREIAKEMAKYRQFFFLGRHLELPIAYESSLKFKEISYLNSQALPSGELKHGSLALIDSEFPSIMLAPGDFLFEKNLSSIQEIKARGGKVLAISDRKIVSSDWSLEIPSTIEELYPFLTAVVGQLIAYHTADILGHDIDKPRNLAKSVTVK